MNDYPKKAYGAWAGYPIGRPYDATRCAEKVHDSHGWLYRQCERKPGYGDRALFCKVHARRHPATEGRLMNRETARLKTEVVDGKLRYDGNDGSGACEQAEHDALYAHALVQAISEQDTDLCRLDPRPLLRVQIRADELMREWGAK